MSILVAELVTKFSADTSGHTAGINKAQAAITQFTKTGDAGAKSAEESAKKTGTHYAAMGQAFSVAGRSMTIAGAAIVGGLAVATKAGADYESKLSQVANNTTMTTGEIAKMHSVIRDMGMNSAAPLSQLADGFMHVSNMGFKASEVQGILSAAMKSAVSTGADTGKTAELLAGVMHQFGMKAGEAAKAMNVLHLAGAQGNMTLEQLVASGGKSFTMAANLGVPLKDVAAALSALTRNGFNAAAASTQVTGMLSKIINPSVSASKELLRLSKLTGIDLVKDFTVTGLAARTLPGVFDDLAAAAKRTHEPLAEMMKKLIPATRGGIGATALAGNAAGDFSQIRKSFDSGGDPTAEAYARSQKTLNSQLAQFHNTMTLLSADVEKALLPVLTPLLTWARQAVQWFGNLPEPVKNFGVVLAAAAGAALTLLGPISSVIGSVLSLAGAAEAAGVTMGGVAAVISGPIGWAIGAVIAATALLVAAWENNWGDIRGKTAAFVEWIKPYLSEAWENIKNVAGEAWGYISDFLKDVWPPIKTIVTTFWNWQVSFYTTVFEIIENLFGGTWENIKGILAGAWSVIRGIVKVGWGLSAGIIDVGLKLLAGDWAGAWDSIQKYTGIIWSGINDIFKGAIQIIENNLRGAVKVFFNIAQDMMQSLRNGLLSMMGPVAQAAGAVGSAAINAVQNAMNSGGAAGGGGIGSTLATGIAASAPKAKAAAAKLGLGSLDELMKHMPKFAGAGAAAAHHFSRGMGGRRGRRSERGEENGGRSGFRHERGAKQNLRIDARFFRCAAPGGRECPHRKPVKARAETDGKHAVRPRNGQDRDGTGFAGGGGGAKNSRREPESFRLPVRAFRYEI